MLPNRYTLRAAGAVAVLAMGLPALWAGEPAAINPFGQAPSQRDDAIPGCIELSNGAIHRGMIYLTRDKRLQIYDKAMERQREIPLQVIQKVECTIKKEWLEKEWKFRETTNDEKLYTGRSYPAREYTHTITLKDGRTITGALSAIVYLEPERDGPVPPGVYQPRIEPQRFILNKRNKGEMGQDLKSLIYVKSIKLGKETSGEATKKGRGTGKR